MRACRLFRRNKGALVSGLLILLIMILSQMAWAQYNPFHSIRDFEDHLTGESAIPSDTVEVPVVFFNLAGSTITTGLLSENFPQVDIPPDTFSIVYPAMPLYLDTIGALWYLRDLTGSTSAITHLMIIGYSIDSAWHFFIDSNNDRIFDDKDSPFLFAPGESQKLILIRNHDKREFGFLLNNPDPVELPVNETDPAWPVYSSVYRAMQEKNRSIYDSVWIEASRKPSFSLRTGFMLGPGHVEMEFAPASDGDLIYSHYKANIFASFMLHAEGIFSWNNISAGVGMGIETLMYSVDHLYITQKYQDTVKTRWIVSGDWPRSKFYYYLFAEYDFRLSRETRLAPFAEVAGYRITSDEVFSKKEGNTMKDLATGLYSWNAGGRFKFIVSRNTMVGISLSYRQSYLDARDYFSDINPDSFRSSHYQIYIGFNYLYRFQGKKQ